MASVGLLCLSWSSSPVSPGGTIIQVLTPPLLCGQTVVPAIPPRSGFRPRRQMDTVWKCPWPGLLALVPPLLPSTLTLHCCPCSHPPLARAASLSRPLAMLLLEAGSSWPQCSRWAPCSHPRCVWLAPLRQVPHPPCIAGACAFVSSPAVGGPCLRDRAFVLSLCVAFQQFKYVHSVLTLR